MKRVKMRVCEFLALNGLRLDDDIEYYAGVFAVSGDEMLAGAGIAGDVMKGVAVSAALRSTGMSTRLISHLVSEAASRGVTSLKVFTKPENRAIFESLGFAMIARAPKAILLENGNGLRDYCASLASLAQGKPSRRGVVVMNANPFTIGHQYLVEEALRKVEHLFVIVVKEDRSRFGYAERLAMVKAGLAGLERVTVIEGSSYTISAATFPTYFLKEITDATDTHITLDLDIYTRHIAPALRADLRFVGSEPADALTARYNELMHRQLPVCGLDVVEVPRVTVDGLVVTASQVRGLLDEGHLREIVRRVPATTLPHIVAQLATRSLLIELDTTPKPGLVDRDDNGAHTDMDYALMRRSIDALHPFFVRLALLGADDGTPDATRVKNLGLAAEQAMLSATGGVNTHKGALFALGLTVVAAAHCRGEVTPSRLQQEIARLACNHPRAIDTHGSRAVAQYNALGALAMAQRGYPALFDDWLPFFEACRHDDNAAQLTLLRIMSELDDTNVLHRCGPQVAQEVKAAARRLLGNYTTAGMRELNRLFVEGNISPGGAADMLALTTLVHALTH